jgi:SulP family sulfate permease
LARIAAPAPGDVVAGVSVALVLVPQALAYAQVAGMPPERGLYAATFAPIAAALFASSPYLQTGPVALTGLLTFGALTALAVPETPSYVELGLLLALVVGVVRLAVGLVRAGGIAYLMSQPMLMGFVPAAGILIVASQFPTALGAEPPEGGILRQAGWSLGHPGAWDASAIGLTLGVIAVMVLGRRVHRLFPSVLVAAGIGVLVGELGHGGALLGTVEGRMPPFSLDLPWGDLHRLLLPGAIIAIVGFAEPASIARTFAARERRTWDPSRELVGQGTANVVAGLTGGFPVGGSFSRSALNHLAGARTRWSGAITGLAVLCFLPFASSLQGLPRAALAGIVIGAVASLVRLLPLARLFRYSLPQFAIAWATFAATLALAPHIEYAVLIGVGLSVAVHLARELSFDLEATSEAGTLHLRPSGVLWFGSAQVLEDRVLRALVDHPDARRLVVHLDGLGRIDLSGALTLRQLLRDARGAGLDVAVEDVPPRAERVVTRVVLRDERVP